MDQQSIREIADDFGLVIESAPGLPGDEVSFRVYKGPSQIFTGNESAVRTFFGRYERTRPRSFFGRFSGHKE